MSMLVPVSVAAVLVTGAAALAFQEAPKYTVETISVSGDATVSAGGQPSGEQREGPDGTMMSVVARNEYKLVVEDLKLGDGAECERRSEVTVHYHGTLSDGRVFDSTRGKEPATFPLARLIPGWQAGLPGMRVGGVRRLVIPACMAYGSKDRVDSATGQVSIPANSELTFTIQLVAARTPAAPVTLPSGLVIEDLVVGTGQECHRGATVTIHYHGTLSDGTVFDSTRGKQPATYPLGNLIQGWQEGIPGMKVGGKRKLTVPYQLGYGEAGMPPAIPARATLTFEIELLGVN